LTRRAHHGRRGGHGGSTLQSNQDIQAAFAHPTFQTQLLRKPL
jgi:hypothetical protein